MLRPSGKVTTRPAYLGVAIDLDANDRANGDTDISSASPAVRTVEVTDPEDFEITRQVHEAIPAG